MEEEFEERRLDLIVAPGSKVLAEPRRLFRRKLSKPNIKQFANPIEYDIIDAVQEVEPRLVVPSIRVVDAMTCLEQQDVVSLHCGTVEHR